MNEAKHASAPPGYKCSDCTMDDEPCPRCYTAWWQARHPDTYMVSVGDSELNALRAELDLRNKGDPVKRLHNLCDALTEQANESPFTKEQWDQLDAENVSLRAELEACKEDVSELRALDNEAQHGADALRAELAAVKADAERYRWLRSRHPPGLMNVPRIWSGPPWDETATLWWEHGADAAIDAARAQAGGK